MVKGNVVHYYGRTNLMMPKITDKPHEPDFIAPSEEWRKFLRTLTRRERIEFYAALEMVLQTIHGAELERVARVLREEYRIVGLRFALSSMLYWN